MTVVTPHPAPSRSRITPSRTQQLAEFAIGTTFADLPAQVVAQTRRITLDTVACAAGALDTAPGRAVVDLKVSQGGTPEATLLARGQRLPVASVSYVHSQLANLLDADETLLNRTHFASAIVMPVLAVAERTGASGRDVVTAVAIGFDIAARVVLSMTRHTSDGGVVRTLPISSSFGGVAFGTAAAVARLLGVDSRSLQHAWGVALVTSPVSFNKDRLVAPLFRAGDAPHWHKYAMYGAIAEAGVNAVELASRGFRSDAHVLDDEAQFWLSFAAPGHAPRHLTEALGSDWRIMDAAIKPYPLCRHGNGSLARFEQLVREHDLEPEDVDEVAIVHPPFAGIKNMITGDWPDDPLKVMMSLPYAMWMVLNRVAPGARWWDPDNLDDARGRAFAATVESRVDAALGDVLARQLEADDYFRELPTTVIVQGPRGTLVAEGRYAKGDPWGESSPMTDEELATKVHDFVDDVLGRAAADDLIRACDGLVDSVDVSRVARAMRGETETGGRAESTRS